MEIQVIVSTCPLVDGDYKVIGNQPNRMALRGALCPTERMALRGALCPTGRMALRGALCPTGRMALQGALCPTGRMALRGALCPTGRMALQGALCPTDEWPYGAHWNMEAIMHDFSKPKIRPFVKRSKCLVNNLSTL